MKTCVFLGPSLPLAEARRLLDAVYLPPARQGDVCRALRDHAPAAIALIDGYFEQVPAVWHKELLWALAQGVRVYGAASMGALRAAELCQFGMVGVGQIFEAYRDGVFPSYSAERFEDDDEVAVSHGPAELGFVGSDAMVDIRATLTAASEGGTITLDLRDRLASLAKGLFYKDRSYQALLQAAADAGFESEALDRFAAWLPTGKIDQKRRDARALLGLLAQGGLVTAVPDFKLAHTVAWEAALRSVEAETGGGN